jgi:hypothetical protein
MEDALQYVSAEIIYCRERARQAREKAEAAATTETKYLAAEARWLALARSHTETYLSESRTHGRHPESIAAQRLACTFPYRRFADILADACARLGADAVRYSFIVVTRTTYSLPVSRRTCAKTRSDVVIMPCGTRMLSLFCSPLDHSHRCGGKWV